MSSSFRVLVVGGGFTGLTVARTLASQASVTLVDPNDHALFTPRLVDALAGWCKETDLRFSHAELAKHHGYRFVQARVSSVDSTKKEALLDDAQTKILPYDTIVFAQGAETNYFTLDGQAHVYPLKTWDHLLALEEQVRKLSILPHPQFAVVGGGATGIEAAIALHERLVALGKPANERSITVYQAAAQILPGFLPATIATCKKLFQAQNIQIHEHAAVSAVEPGMLTKGHSEKVPADLVLWASGVKPAHIDGTTPNDERGNLLPNHSLQLAPHAFAGGDTVLFKDGQMTVPKNAQTAMNMGALIAKNILREQAGRPLLAYRYRSPGVMLWLGRTSVTDLFGRSFASPFFTWIREQFYRLRWHEITG